MIQPQKSWTIGALGLTEGETKLLTSMASLTRSRADGSYVIGTPANINDWHIVIINMDDREAVIQWRTLTVRPQPPVSILYTNEAPNDPLQHYLLRPFGPAKLLSVLDGIAKKLSESSELWNKPVLQAEPAASVESTLRALVVDDSPTVTKQIELELRKFGVMADLAETGERGLELLGLHRYDLIFLDVVLPGTDGYQVCKEIRKAPKTKQTPVIMLTSKSSPFDRVRGSLVGCSAYLTKPVDYTAFHEAIGKYIKKEA
ncbi:MAG TPA: response regulator [Gallionellaceae bacterium]